MGLLSLLACRARLGPAASVAADRRVPAPLRHRWKTVLRVARGLILALALGTSALADGPDRLRVLTLHTELGQKGPGLLFKGLSARDLPRAAAVVEMLVELSPDVAVLQGIDYDATGAALDALGAWLSEAGLDLPHRFALRPNAGMATGVDLDGDGRLGTADDAQGWGRFAGAGGMAVLSRHPILAEDAVDLSRHLWRDLPGAAPPPLSAEAAAVQRLSSVGHWVVPIRAGEHRLDLLVWHATPPVFDGPEDRNGRRNHDEAALWLHHLETASPGPLMVAGLANLDPADGEGQRDALSALLSHPRLQDPAPRSARADDDPGHAGDPRLDTAWFEQTGGLRLSYLLPSRDLRVRAAGVHWPQPTADAPRHRPVWVDLDWPPP